MKKILITGGTGSFGSTMVQHLLSRNEVAEIVVFSRDELKQHEMQNRINSLKLKFIVGDIRDRAALERAMRSVDTVFHAAALKQVPTGEFFPMELVNTNVLGTQNVLDVAEQTSSVKKVVVLSTDKAVYPINTMGISKALGERLVTCRGRYPTDTVFCIVRYGNVMASRGSVIPLFIEKIKTKVPIPITDPSMTRFLLSIDDAINLVFLAIEKGQQGDLFIKKAPAATIGDLTQALLNIFNSKSNIDIIGTRAGEKIHETLATNLELMRSADLGDYLRISSEATLASEDFFEKGKKVEFVEDYTSENTKRLNIQEIESLLLSLDYIKNELKEYQKNI